MHTVHILPCREEAELILYSWPRLRPSHRCLHAIYNACKIADWPDRSFGGPEAGNTWWWNRHSWKIRFGCGQPNMCFLSYTVDCINLKSILLICPMFCSPMVPFDSSLCCLGEEGISWRKWNFLAFTPLAPFSKVYIPSLSVIVSQEGRAAHIVPLQVQSANFIIYCRPLHDRALKVVTETRDHHVYINMPRRVSLYTCTWWLRHHRTSLGKFCQLAYYCVMYTLISTSQNCVSLCTIKNLMRHHKKSLKAKSCISRHHRTSLKATSCILKQYRTSIGKTGPTGLKNRIRAVEISIHEFSGTKYEYNPGCRKRPSIIRNDRGLSRDNHFVTLSSSTSDNASADYSVSKTVHQRRTLTNMSRGKSRQSP